VLEHRGLLESPGLRLSVVRCRGEHAWSPEEQVTHSSVVLVRRGVFLRRVDATVAVADVTTGYVQRPGECQQVAHPAGGDVCTSISVPDDLAERFARAGPVVVSAGADLAHRRLIARTRSPDAGRPDVLDLAAALVDALLPPSRANAPSAAARRAVDEVRAALHTDPALGLDDLAALAGWSPWYLSRTFRRVTGATVGAYRRTLRVRAALDELTDGGGGGGGDDAQATLHGLTSGRDGLAALAVRVGFADQAHLTRAMRREIDMPPAAARRWLRGESR
jgi:AraC-like DNA-binding protein